MLPTNFRFHKINFDKKSTNIKSNSNKMCQQARVQTNKSIVETKKITFARNTNFNVSTKRKLWKAIAEMKTKLMYDIV